MNEAQPPHTARGTAQASLSTGLATEFERRLRPGATPTSLPPETYTSAEFHGLEADAIFSREWVCAGRAASFPPDSYRTLDLCGNPIAVIGTDRGIRAYSNVCRHRGMPLLSGSGRAKRLVCPYHAWTYAAENGALLAAPYMGNALDTCKADIRLTALRCEVWNGLVFVSLDQAASAAGHELEGLDEAIAPFRPEAFQPLFEVDEVYATNWKCFVENFIESYHLFQVHRRTVQRRTPTSSVSCRKGGKRHALHWLTERPGARPGASPDPHLDPALAGKELLAAIFPSTLLSVTGNLLLWLTALPEGERRTRVIGGLCASPHLLKRSAGDARLANRLKAEFDLFMAEDRAVVERLMHGLGSSLAREGILSPLEQPVWEFGLYLRRTILGPFGPASE